MKQPIEPFVKIPTKIARNPAISPMAKTLYMVLKSYNPSFPSFKKLCLDTGIKSKTTLKKYLNELESMCYIRINSGGFNQSNNYEVFDSPNIEQVGQFLTSLVSNNGLRDGHNLDSNKNKLIISNKSQEDSSAIASEEPLGKPVSTEELSLTISNILNGRY